MCVSNELHSLTVIVLNIILEYDFGSSVVLLDLVLTPLSTILHLYRGVLLVEEIGGPGENHRPAVSH